MIFTATPCDRIHITDVVLLTHTEMNTQMLVTREETFAPVVGLYRFKTEEEALDLANDCDVGLGSFVCTSDISRMWRVAEALEVG